MKKIWDCPLAHKRLLVEANYPTISLSRQCNLLDLARSSWYYKPVEVDLCKLYLMNL
ncbi:hypothetical protein HJG54_02245 [Leptolyngbya sp. NK1-12]|uniref:Uncharacterized protein n=1 Tax=Leptolyngbya sp. NK1-12 TaxID=2547451 RepID=A0AA96WB10_9CYAN|nr:hypothetical protein [Leptolyngbya sp. NK1-12]WNZ21804.1 hypothetical protein HJG54_02245 [Leptolyngbya sp. NK1-12]